MWLLKWSTMLQATGATEQWCVDFSQDSLFILIPLVLVSRYFQVLLELWSRGAQYWILANLQYTDFIFILFIFTHKKIITKLLKLMLTVNIQCCHVCTVNTSVTLLIRHMGRNGFFYLQMLIINELILYLPVLMLCVPRSYVNKFKSYLCSRLRIHLNACFIQKSLNWNDQKYSSRDYHVTDRWMWLSAPEFQCKLLALILALFAVWCHVMQVRKKMYVCHDFWFVGGTFVYT